MSNITFKITTLDPCGNLPPKLCEPLLIKYNVIPFDDPVKMEALNFGMHTFTSWQYRDIEGHWNAYVRANRTATFYWYQKLYKPGDVKPICLPTIMYSGMMHNLVCWNVSETYERDIVAEHTFKYQFEKHKTDVIIGSTLILVIMIFGIFGNFRPNFVILFSNNLSLFVCLILQLQWLHFFGNITHCRHFDPREAKVNNALKIPELENCKVPTEYQELWSLQVKSSFF